ncbi:MAG: tRNA (adenosine(37)-N6)-threonylcarbamoyltransferase complex dimerization subunit type 1 TsaB [Terriglobales bacterium]
MLLLAVDSSDKNGSIALAKCGPGEACDVLEVILLAGGTFSAQLVPQIAALLNKHEFSKEDIGAFAVVSGPGSFTGLRIGLAAVKALGEILEKPIAAVSLLEAVAIAGKTRGRVMAALDAGRNEVYAGEYEVESGVERIDERLVTQPELIKIAAGRTVVTPDRKLADIVRAAGLAVAGVERPGSDAIARIGWRKILSGEIVSPEMLDANYIRRMDGEIMAKNNS